MGGGSLEMIAEFFGTRCRPALAIAERVFARLGTVYWSATTSIHEPDWAWALYLDKGAAGGLPRAAPAQRG
jgi:hypothetical protein